MKSSSLSVIFVLAIACALIVQATKRGCTCGGMGPGTNPCTCDEIVVKAAKLQKPAIYSSPQAINEAAAARALAGRLEIPGGPTNGVPLTSFLNGFSANSISSASDAYNVFQNSVTLSGSSTGGGSSSCGCGKKSGGSLELREQISSGGKIAPRFPPIGDLCYPLPTHPQSGKLLDITTKVTPAYPGKMKCYACNPSSPYQICINLLTGQTTTPVTLTGSTLPGSAFPGSTFSGTSSVFETSSSGEYDTASSGTFTGSSSQDSSESTSGDQLDGLSSVVYSQPGTGSVGGLTSGTFGGSNSGSLGSISGGYGASGSGSLGALISGGYGASASGSLGALISGGYSGSTSGSLGLISGGYGGSSSGAFGGSNSGAFGGSSSGAFGGSSSGAFGGSSSGAFGGSSSGAFGGSSSGAFGGSSSGAYGGSSSGAFGGFHSGSYGKLTSESFGGSFDGSTSSVYSGLNSGPYGGPTSGPFGRPNIGKPHGQYPLSQTISSGAFDEDADFIEVEKTYPEVPADAVSLTLAYRNLHAPNILYRQGKKFVPEDKLAFGHRTVPSDVQKDKQTPDIPEEKLVTVEKPVVELRLTPPTSAFIGSYDRQEEAKLAELEAIERETITQEEAADQSSGFISYKDLGYAPVGSPFARTSPSAESTGILSREIEDRSEGPCGPLGPRVPGYIPGSVVVQQEVVETESPGDVDEVERYYEDGESEEEFDGASSGFLSRLQKISKKHHRAPCPH